jgi:hypothetical protein
MVVEGSVDLLVIVTILFECQLGLQAVFITKSSGPEHQSRQYCLFIGWVIIGLGAEVAIGMWACGTLCVSESHPVSCKYPSPGMGGDHHFRFPR